jgi:hypothetical protein
MPQAKSGGSRSKANTGGSSGSKRSTGASSRGGGRTSSASRSSAGKSRAAGSSARAKSASATKTRSSSGTASEARDAAAQRIRKLNERIIEAGRGAGDATLTSYERALKMIADSLERGPGKSDVEWISNLATAQAKFIRDVTEAWTKAARDVLK